MKACPNCEQRMHVQQTVETDDVIYRCRKCKACGWLLTTEERISSDQDQTLLYKVQHAKRKERTEHAT